MAAQEELLAKAETESLSLLQELIGQSEAGDTEGMTTTEAALLALRCRFPGKLPLPPPVHLQARLSSCSNALTKALDEDDFEAAEILQGQLDGTKVRTGVELVLHHSVHWQAHRCNLSCCTSVAFVLPGSCC